MLFRQKISAIVVAILCLLLSLAFGSESGQQTYSAHWTDTPPVMDGVLSEGEYGAAIPLHVTFDQPTTTPGVIPPAFHPPDNTDDLSYTIYAMYDEDNIYIAVDVTDDIIFDDGPAYGSPGSEWEDFDLPFWDDCVELCIDGDDIGNDFQSGPGKEGFKVLVDVGGKDAYAHDGGPIENGLSVPPFDYCEFAPGLRPGGYVVEFMIALSWIDVIDGEGEAAPGPGSSIGFNVYVDDDDTGGEGPDSFGAWDGNSSDFMSSREEDWGTLYLCPEIVRRLRERVVSATTTLGATRAGQPTPLEVTVVLDAPLETTESVQRMILDLAPLGIPSQLPLDHVGEGRYTASTTITPLQTGWYSLPVLVETAEEKRYRFLEVTLEVYPEDLSIYEDGPGAGWIVELSNAESDPNSSAFVRNGSSSHAILLQPGIFPGRVEYVFDDPEGIDSFGYSHLEFYINGGEASGQDPQIGVKKLSERGVVVESDTWMLVSLPISELSLVKGRLRSFRIHGTVKETFYIDDMKLVAEEPPTPEPTAVEVSEGMALPSGYALSQNYPNPFNPETTIRYDVAKTGTVRLSMYALTGQLVRTLMDGGRAAGSYSVTWDGTDDAGRDVASGVYLCRMEGGEYRAVRKLVLVR